MVTQIKYLLGATAALAVLILAHIDPGLAQDAAAAAPAATPPTPPPSPINTGDTAWMITSTALVLMMTIPGLGLFYGGMVRKKNVLATSAQSFGATCIITVLWMIIGYSIAFTTNPDAECSTTGSAASIISAGADDLNAVSRWRRTIPESVYMFFQMTFAIITPALIAGRAGRPHEVFRLHVVHVAVAAARLLPDRPLGVGRRLAGRLGRARLCRRHGRASERRNRGLVTCLVLGQAHRLRHREHGAAQSGLQRDRRFAAVGGLVRLQRRLGRDRQCQCRHGRGRDPNRDGRSRAGLDVRRMDYRQEAHVLGMISGAVAGLVAITPASGFVDPTGALIIGIAAGVVCYFSSVHVKKALGYDDALDAWGVHGVAARSAP